MPLSRTFTLSLAASSSTGVALSQTSSGGVGFTINGGLAVSGVATFDVPRRVLVSPTGNESTNIFTITGTDYYGRPQTEALAGLNATSSYTIRDFATVSGVIPTTTTAAVVTVGTNGVGSSVPYVVDQWAAPAIGIGTVVGAVPVTYTVEISDDNLFPAYNINATPPNYYPLTQFNGIGNNAHGVTNEPITMIRTTILSGTGSVITNFRQGYVGRG